MAEGRQRDEWGRTSSLMAIIAEANRDKKKRSRPFKPSDFNPFAQHVKQEPIAQAPITALKDIFIHGRMPAIDPPPAEQQP
jgi:hypothetical protein